MIRRGRRAIGAVLLGLAAVNPRAAEPPAVVPPAAADPAPPPAVAHAGFAGALEPGVIFGRAVTAIGDLDGDGVVDLAIGSGKDRDGGPGRGAVWILFMRADGTVRAHRKISATEGGLRGPLGNGHNFGVALDGPGDLDGDGIPDLIVGAMGDRRGRGAAWLLSLARDGSVRRERRLAADTGFPAPIPDAAWFGCAIATLPGPDGTTRLAVAGRRATEPKRFSGAVWITTLGPRPGADGAEADAPVHGARRLRAFRDPLDETVKGGAEFGTALATLGDLDGDGATDLAVGGRGDDGRGAVWILFLDEAGAVRRFHRITPGSAEFPPALVPQALLGFALADLGDLDGDGTRELAVGARDAAGGGEKRGAVWILSLRPNGTVARSKQLGRGEGDAPVPLADADRFGTALAALPAPAGGEAVVRLAVGARGDDAAGADAGAVWLLDLDAGLRVRAVSRVP